MKMSKLFLAGQVNTLKHKFDVSYNELLDKLSGLPGDILQKCLGNNPKKQDKDKLNGYWMSLQAKVNAKKNKLSVFQNELNKRTHRIRSKIDYMDMSGSNTLQGPSGTQPASCSHRYTPNPTFLPPDRKKPWITTASDHITDVDLTTISEWLRSRAHTENILTQSAG